MNSVEHLVSASQTSAYSQHFPSQLLKMVKRFHVIVFQLLLLLICGLGSRRLVLLHLLSSLLSGSILLSLSYHVELRLSAADDLHHVQCARVVLQILLHSFLLIGASSSSVSWLANAPLLSFDAM